MANEQNLKPFGKGNRTVNEERAMQARGGVNSGKTRRKKKTLAENMKFFLELPIFDLETAKELETLGIDKKDLDNSQLIVLALFNEARSGNVNAIKEIRTMIGEENVQNQEQMDKLDAVLEQIGGVI